MHSVSVASTDGAVTLARLFPVSLFGEMALLDPWTGCNDASVIAETHVELLAISKKQFDMRCASEAFLANVRRRSTSCPATAQVAKLAALQERWSGYKQTLVDSIKKARWPPRQERLRLNHVAEDDHLLPSDLGLADVM